MKIAICDKCGDAYWADRMHPRIPRYCKPCGENLLPDDEECPFCGQATIPVDAPTPHRPESQVNHE